jgi:hypothetical protein
VGDQLRNVKVVGSLNSQPCGHQPKGTSTGTAVSGAL